MFLHWNGWIKILYTNKIWIREKEKKWRIDYFKINLRKYKCAIKREPFKCQQYQKKKTKENTHETEPKPFQSRNSFSIGCQCLIIICYCWFCFWDFFSFTFFTFLLFLFFNHLYFIISFICLWHLLTTNKNMKWQFSKFAILLKQRKEMFVELEFSFVYFNYAK